MLPWRIGPSPSRVVYCAIVPAIYTFGWWARGLARTEQTRSEVIPADPFGLLQFAPREKLSLQCNKLLLQRATAS